MSQVVSGAGIRLTAMKVVRPNEESADAVSLLRLDVPVAHNGHGAILTLTFRRHLLWLLESGRHTARSSYDAAKPWQVEVSNIRDKARCRILPPLTELH